MNEWLNKNISVDLANKELDVVVSRDKVTAFNSFELIYLYHRELMADSEMNRYEKLPWGFKLSANHPALTISANEL